MDRWFGKVAIVTGASAGIGASISKILVQNGLKVAGLARRIDRLQELSNNLTDAPGQLLPIRCDITNEDAILKAFKLINENLGAVHILINNAGLSRPTNLTEGATDEWRKVFDVNVMALCICTREAIKIMRENNIAGHVIHMNSTVGHYVPTMTSDSNFNVYPASKFAVTALTESLRQELRQQRSPIKVTSVSPDDLSAMRPDDVAEAIVYILSTPPHVQVHELTLGEFTY